jgi:hypothetical protein
LGKRRPEQPDEFDESSDELGFDESGSFDDLSESSSFVYLTTSDARRWDEGGDVGASSDGELVASDPEIQPDSDDLTESTAFVVLTQSDTRRLDQSVGGKPVAVPPAGKGKRPGRRPGSRPRRTPAAAPPPRRSRWPLAVILLFVWLFTLWGAYLIGRNKSEGERSALLARLNRAEGQTGAVQELEGALRSAKGAHERELQTLRDQSERLRGLLATARADLTEQRDRWDAERRALASDRVRALRELEQGFTEQERQQVLAAQLREEERAERMREDLDKQARETISRYETLLEAARAAESRAIAAAREEARADALEREAVLQQQLAERIQTLEAEKESELALQAERIESELREQLAAEAAANSGNDEGIFGDDGTGSGDSPGIDLEEEVWEHLSGHLSGSAEYRLFAHFSDGSQPDAEQFRNEGLIKLRYEVDPTDWLTFAVEPRVHFDDDSLSHGTQRELTDTAVQRPIFTLEEAEVSATFGDFDLRFGKLIYGWGAADLTNPTDVINPQDLTDLIDSRKIGVPSFEASYFLGDGTMKLVGGYVPLFTHARFAPPNERFSPIPLGPGPAIEFIDLPARRFENGEGFFRMEGIAGDVDLSTTFVYQWNPIPNLVAEIDPTAAAAPFFVRLAPTFDRRYLLGVDATTVLFDDYVVAAELAEVITDGNRDDDYLSFVLSARRDFVPFDRTVTVTLEYSGEWIQKKASDAAVVSNPFQRIFANALLSRITLSPIDYLEMQLTSAVLFDGDENAFVQPEARYEFTTHSRIEAGFDLFLGPDETFFGELSENNRFYMRLRLTF